MKLHQLFISEAKNYLVSTYGKKLMSAFMGDDSAEAKALRKIHKPERIKSEEDPKAELGETEQRFVAAIIAELEKADPIDGKKNREWIIRMYTKRLFKLEDTPRLKTEIQNFFRLKNKLEKKDLNSYNSLNDLYDAVEAADQEPEEKSKTQIDKEISEKGVEWMIRTPDYMALVPKTIEASIKYGANTKWCTAGESAKTHFNYYASRGDLTIIIAKFSGKFVAGSEGKFRKFQFHFSTHSFMNERDQVATQDEIKELSAHLEHLKLLHMLIDKHVGN